MPLPALLYALAWALVDSRLTLVLVVVASLVLGFLDLFVIAPLRRGGDA